MIGYHADQALLTGLLHGLGRLYVVMRAEDRTDVTAEEIREIARVSKPGRRVYVSVKSIPQVANGLGIAILSTPKGVMADHQAREENVGGEILCQIF